MMKKFIGCFLTTVVVVALALGSRSAVLAAQAQTPPVAAASTNSVATPPAEESVSRGVTLRDPSTILRCKGEFWVFHTGRGVMSYHSKDLVKWERGPRVFTNAPDWIAQAVPENRGSYWAPDIIHLGDRYLLYYSASSLGKNTSAIGLATNPTLDSNDPAYRWTDQGLVVQSRASNDFNTIDPAIFHDADGSLWLSFGSYWSGIKMIQLDPQTGKRITPDSPVTSLAHNSSIEASYLCQRGGDYYLFVNWGSCLQGAKSTYNIRVGRSRKVTGPYLDKKGVDMLAGGGSLFLGARGQMIGPGHAGIIVDKGTNWFSCHFEYDGGRGGATTLALLPLHWNADGWPEAEMIPAN